MVTVLLSFFDFDVSVVQCLLLQNVLITFVYKNHFCCLQLSCSL